MKRLIHSLRPCVAATAFVFGLALAAVLRGEVVYDQGTSAIGGKPFLVKGVYGVGMEEMGKVAGYGFNVVQNYGFSGWTDEQVADYLKQAQNRKLKVLFHLGVNKLTPDVVDPVRRRVGKFKDHPALYAWYLADEPSVAKYKPEDLAALYQWIKKTDPAHPVFSSNWELNNFKDACDVDMPQFYHGPPSRLRNGPLPQRQSIYEKNGVPWIAIANTHDALEFSLPVPPDAECLSPAYLMKNEGAAKHLPDADPGKIRTKIKAIQTHLANPPYKTLPAFPDTPEKVRGQAFAMMAHGSNGIFYWLYQPEDSINEQYGYYTIFTRPALRDALKSTLAELDTLWPRICAPAKNSTTWYDKETKDVFCWFRRETTRITLMLVNESTATHNVNTPIPSLERYPVLHATVSGENRRVKIENGILKDQFSGNQTHIYLIDPQ
ncbi:hypothetical protein KBB96_07260 [Luteolibacter ambystomatis]|uniref:Glycoside hydrolase family 2 catalytic domain-containing protein n=1 Tax=Luteolibacter ambystomatis TaxID=2824561 RepID=A0A975J2B4_9BACT|nr:glycoside hydrolase family 2 TIM barrel-domain containing protein [Luteolibacter ambystomatis]QUE52684.1 hypothetical protein KBB96_07260 [Luteolibacter ambystomatis]